MKNEKWFRLNQPSSAKRVLSLYSSKRLLISLSVTRYFKPSHFIEPVVPKGLGGIIVRKLKRSRWQRLCFWFLRLKFEDLTIKELKKLSATEQKKHLYEKYRLYGVIPQMKDHVDEKG